MACSVCCIAWKASVRSFRTALPTGVGFVCNGIFPFWSVGFGVLTVDRRFTAESWNCQQLVITKRSFGVDGGRQGRG